jgi:glucose/galactose transporter
MGICNKVGGMLAPLVLGALVLRGMDQLSARLQSADAAGKTALREDFAAAIRTPYRSMALVLVVLAVGTRYSPLPDVQATTESAAAGSARGLFRHPHVWLGALCIFVYVGVEVMAGDAIGTYGKGFDLPLDRTKLFTSFTLAAMLLGYGAGLLAIPRWVSQERYLVGSAVLGVLLTIGAFCTSGSTSVAFVAALGFANAMMWPAIFPLAIRGLGALTEAGSALLVMGIVGGAIVPQIFAIGKQHHHFQWVFLAVMVPCYLYIAFFGLLSRRAAQKVPTSAT